MVRRYSIFSLSISTYSMVSKRKRKGLQRLVAQPKVTTTTTYAMEKKKREKRKRGKKKTLYQHKALMQTRPFLFIYINILKLLSDTLAAESSLLQSVTAFAFAAVASLSPNTDDLPPSLINDIALVDRTGRITVLFLSSSPHLLGDMSSRLRRSSSCDTLLFLNADLDGRKGVSSKSSWYPALGSLWPSGRQFSFDPNDGSVWKLLALFDMEVLLVQEEPRRLNHF